MLTLDHPTPEDWLAIGALANEAVRHIPGAPVQTEWLENRRAYTGPRHHWIAREDGEPVGYGAIEHRTDRHRLFLVLSWINPGATAIADALIAGLQREFVGVGKMWMLEYADDTPFLNYLRTHGFTVGDGFDHEGMAVARLEYAQFA